jgi:hypothetical protein
MKKHHYSGTACMSLFLLLLTGIAISQPRTPITLWNSFNFRNAPSTHGGYLYVDNQDLYPSGTTVSLLVGTLHDFRPEIHKYQAQSGNVRFQHWWDGTSNPDINYRDHMVQWPASFWAKFFDGVSQTLLVSADNTLLDAGLLIRDPWRIVYGAGNTATNDDTFQPFSIPTQGYPLDDFNGFGGVHYSKYNTSGYPYYGIRSSAALHWNGSFWGHQDPATASAIGDLVFDNWRSNDENLVETKNLTNPAHAAAEYNTKDIIFYDNGGITTASYKAHLLSNKAISTSTSSCPTCPNSQRKLDYRFDPVAAEGKYHAVYESMDEVWYLFSTDAGATWSKEVRLSSGIGKASHPSLYVSGEDAFVTWNEAGTIIVGKYSAGAFMAFDFGAMRDPTTDAAPVIAHDAVDTVTFVAYETGQTPEINYLVFKAYDLKDESIYPPYVPGTSCRRPTLAYESSAQKFHLAWLEAGVYLASSTLFVNTKVYPIQQFFTEEAYSYPPLSCSYVGAPSMTVVRPGLPYNEYLGLACAVFNDANGWNGVVVGFKQPGLGVWVNSQMIFNSSPDEHWWGPSISSINQYPCGSNIDNVRVAYNHTVGSSTREIWVADLQCGTWGTNVQATNALSPSSVALHLPGAGRDLFPTFETTAIPAPLSSSLVEIRNSGTFLGKRVNLSERRARELVFQIDSTFVQYGIGDISISSGNTKQSLQWYHPVDTFVVGRDITIENAFRTESIVLPANARVDLQRHEGRKGGGILPSGFQISTQVVDVNTGGVLATVHQTGASQLSGVNNLRSSQALLHGLAGREIFLRVSAINIPANAKIQTFDYYNNDQLATNAFPKQTESVISESAPRNIEIAPVYPNPIAYTATVSYSIGADGHVRLSLYNVGGQRVRTLVNDHRNAGTYVVTLNGSELPAGVYVCKLEANGETVSSTLTISK